jgi:hypothetical protein
VLVCRVLPVVLLLLCILPAAGQDGDRHYAHDVVLDADGIIAPWYAEPNGQFDERARVAADTLLRYPWATSPTPAPHYVYSGAWNVSDDGTISLPPLGDWDNGDLGQRMAYVLSGLTDYYRYSGDAAAIAHLYAAVDVLLAHGLTDEEHSWPGFPISVPTKGKPYGHADPHGFIQLDIVGEVGYALVQAYRLTGERRWLEAATRWGIQLAQHCDTRPGSPPWGRYANPEDVPWEDLQTGGVVFILCFLDELIAMGVEGPDGIVPQARQAGVAYLRDVLLPDWLTDDTWGRNYWDWNDPVQAENVTEFVCRYLIQHPDEFPNWRTDARNIMSLFLNRTSVSPHSMGGVYSGAWAYPESSSCCGLSLWYGPMELAPVWLEYGAVASDPWATEVGRRQAILATYDFHPTGVVEDNIMGGAIVAGAWFKIAHPMALKHVLNTIAWMPELGASGENHILYSTGTIREVTYEPNDVAYTVVSPLEATTERLRLAFVPREVTVGGAVIDTWSCRPLGGGDHLAEVTHLSGLPVRIVGIGDPARAVEETAFQFEGDWRPSVRASDSGRMAVVGDAPGDEAKLVFDGDHLQIAARYGPRGGLADVYIDGERQLRGLDLWCPQTRHRAVAWRRGGLGPGPHELRIVVRGEGNPRSAGRQIVLDGAQFGSSPQPPSAKTVQGRPEAQRVIFGYPHRQDYVDTNGHAWRPATEWTIRLGHEADAVREAWWTARRLHQVAGTDDAELYRYGAHGREFAYTFTVPPGDYHLVIHLAESRRSTASLHAAVTVLVNGEVMLEDVDVAATAGGLGRATHLVLEPLRPVAGAIEVRFRNDNGGEAICQALELVPGRGPAGHPPVRLAVAARTAGNLLANPGFEAGFSGVLGRLGASGETGGWRYLFAGAGQAYVYPESAYIIHPDWGLPVYYAGQEALRTHGHEAAVTMVFQEVAVAQGAEYQASVWVRGCDLRGKGFGASPGDSAVLRIQEIGRTGEVVAEHRSIQAAVPNEWTRLEVLFPAQASTARVRFLLESRIDGPYDEGHITYDEASLTLVSDGDGGDQ